MKFNICCKSFFHRKVREKWIMMEIRLEKPIHFPDDENYLGIENFSNRGKYVQVMQGLQRMFLSYQLMAVKMDESFLRNFLTEKQLSRMKKKIRVRFSIKDTPIEVYANWINSEMINVSVGLGEIGVSPEKMSPETIEKMLEAHSLEEERGDYNYELEFEIENIEYLREKDIVFVKQEKGLLN